MTTNLLKLNGVHGLRLPRRRFRRLAIFSSTWLVAPSPRPRKFATLAPSWTLPSPLSHTQNLSPNLPSATSKTSPDSGHRSQIPLLEPSSTHSSPPAWTYCSGVLFWTPPARTLDGLQYVQNSVTRVLTRAKLWHHVTPTLKHCYWLLVNFRITYKLLNLSMTLALGPLPSTFPVRPILRSSNLRSPLNQQGNPWAFSGEAPPLSNSLTMAELDWMNFWHVVSSVFM